MGSLVEKSIKSIAIIGGGPSGIAAAKGFIKENRFSDIQIFEQSDSVVGTWGYSALDSSDACDVPQTSPFQPLETPKGYFPGKHDLNFTTPMYENLESNIPKEFMRYAAKPFSNDVPLYAPRETVCHYLQDYATDIMDLIQFHTQVKDVRLLPGAGTDTWSLTSCDLRTRKQKTQTFDAVAVCSGHYSTPFIPSVPGLKEWASEYPESVGHSKFYRSPARFKGKKVVVVGNSASGSDIANQISQVSQHPLVVSLGSSSRPADPPSGSKIERVTQRSQIAAFLSPSTRSRALRFEDGHVETDVDFVLFCTGYLYSLPFLSSFPSELIKDGSRIHNLYQHMFFIDHPSLAFFVLPIRVIPFPLAEVQAAVAAKVWSGQLTLPSKQQMREWEENTSARNGPGKKFLTLDGGKDFEYHNELYEWAEQAGFAKGLGPHKWTDREFWFRRRFKDVKQAYARRGQDRFNVRTPEELGFRFEEQNGSD